MLSRPPLSQSLFFSDQIFRLQREGRVAVLRSRHRSSKALQQSPSGTSALLAQQLRGIEATLRTLGLDFLLFSTLVPAGGGHLNT